MSPKVWLLILVCTAVAAAVVLIVLVTASRQRVRGSRPDWALHVDALPGQWASTGAASAVEQGRILMWGGRLANGIEPSALAALSFSSGRVDLVPTNGPRPRALDYPVMACDGGRRVVWLFGGWPRGAAAPTAQMYRVDAAAMPVAWERLPSREPWPAARNGAGLIYDPQRNRLLLFGGDAGPGAVGFTPLADLWEFDVARGTWREISADGTRPPPRWHMMMVADGGSGKAYMIGGAGLPPDSFDRALYEVDMNTHRWRRLPERGQIPPSLQGASLTIDSEHRALVLVGGLRHEPPGPATASDVWIYDLAAASWSKIDGGEQLRRRDHVAAYDAGSGAHYLVGGQVSETIGNFYESGRPVQAISRLKLVRRPEGAAR